MADEKITKAIENADSSVSIETTKNDSVALRIIKQALINSKNNGSFFNELVKLAKDKDAEGKQIGHGTK